jgi:hypothetical protein
MYNLTTCKELERLSGALTIDCRYDQRQTSKATEPTDSYVIERKVL